MRLRNFRFKELFLGSLASVLIFFLALSWVNLFYNTDANYLQGALYAYLPIMAVLVAGKIFDIGNFSKLGIYLGLALLLESILPIYDRNYLAMVIVLLSPFLAFYLTLMIRGLKRGKHLSDFKPRTRPKCDDCGSRMKKGFGTVTAQAISGQGMGPEIIIKNTPVHLCSNKSCNKMAINYRLKSDLDGYSLLYEYGNSNEPVEFKDYVRINEMDISYLS